MSSSLPFLVYIICILLSCSYCSLQNSTECKKISGCVCVLPDGIGVNLTPLFDEVTWLNATSGNATFHFHPCSDVSVGTHSGNDDCVNGSAICLFNKTTNKFQNLGLTEEIGFFFNDTTEPPVIRYVHGNITTAVRLQCSYSKKSVFTFLDIHSEGVEYQLNLNSRWACPAEIPTFYSAHQNPNDGLLTARESPNDGLSTGSVLVIIFFVFTTLYFVGGALALKFLRGAEGREMIPNYDFWVDLPKLVRDGTDFVISGCQTNPSYDRI